MYHSFSTCVVLSNRQQCLVKGTDVHWHANIHLFCLALFSKLASIWESLESTWLFHPFFLSCTGFLQPQLHCHASQTFGWMAIGGFCHFFYHKCWTGRIPLHDAFLIFTKFFINYTIRNWCISSQSFVVDINSRVSTRIGLSYYVIAHIENFPFNYNFVCLFNVNRRTKTESCVLL